MFRANRFVDCWSAAAAPSALEDVGPHVVLETACHASAGCQPLELRGPAAVRHHPLLCLQKRHPGLHGLPDVHAGAVLPSDCVRQFDANGVGSGPRIRFRLGLLTRRAGGCTWFGPLADLAEHHQQALVEGAARLGPPGAVPDGELLCGGCVAVVLAQLGARARRGQGDSPRACGKRPVVGCHLGACRGGLPRRIHVELHVHALCEPAGLQHHGHCASLDDHCRWRHLLQQGLDGPERHRHFVGTWRRPLVLGPGNRAAPAAKDQPQHLLAGRAQAIREFAPRWNGREGRGGALRAALLVLFPSRRTRLVSDRWTGRCTDGRTHKGVA
mmetsp:Transcript_19331/g.58095  ORF Transcript_19331/g.58095 Transcript_19331/m.58095 type:complete len:328 (+) Transcript_19331:331-1314(+)